MDSLDRVAPRHLRELATGSLVDLGSWLILLASAVALLRFRVSSSLLILGGGLVSVLAQSLG